MLHTNVQYVAKQGYVKLFPHKAPYYTVYTIASYVAYLIYNC